MVSGHDRSHQLLAPDDVQDSRQIIGQDRECHLGGYFWEGFGEEVCRSHASLHRAERMLDCPRDAVAWPVGLHRVAAAPPRADAHAPIA